LASIAIWDRAVMMPEGGSEARAAAMAELQVLLVEIMNSPETGDLMARAEGEVSQLSLWQQANLREMKRAWLLETAVEADLVEAKSIASARCEQAWRQLRAENNW